MEIMQLVFSWTQPHTTIKDLTFSFSTRIAMHLTKIVLIQQLKYKTQTSKTGLTLHLTEDRKKPTFYQMFTLFQYSLRIQKKKKNLYSFTLFPKVQYRSTKERHQTAPGILPGSPSQTKNLPQAALQNKNLQSSRAGSHLIRPLRICRQPQT